MWSTLGVFRRSNAHHILLCSHNEVRSNLLKINLISVDFISPIVYASRGAEQVGYGISE